MVYPSLAAALAVLLSLTAAGARAQDPPPAASNTLNIAVSGVNSAKGHVRVDICHAEEFLKDCRYGGAAPSEPGVTVVTVTDLPPGVYAVQAYQDKNDNHTVDRDFLGLPTEGVGFSNDAPIRMQPPTFGSAAFSYAGGQQTIALRLRHFAG
ncbi:MAG TPA: DUF2141 domain-containing protein [Phenylobacterium sp.]|jgi:uncharacterized protein (DUF2141 family)|uniref:DUF2141 domain-containing protein n=1 Tax=Phenylobacterium sp. TaxID=1871053 RepID=UPI002CB3AA8B|nr:DUF2141 domain-containing protein [Phenylobacterium sp.]HXA40580.1 DUF2141 domain-containing protein [Phenylobacterium sp.]